MIVPTVTLSFLNRCGLLSNALPRYVASAVPYKTHISSTNIHFIQRPIAVRRKRRTLQNAHILNENPFYPTPYRGTSQAPYPTKRTYPQRKSILSSALPRYVIKAVSYNKCRCLTTKQKSCINIYNFWQLVAIAAKKNKKKKKKNKKKKNMKKNMNMKTNKKTRRTVLFILISVHLNGFYL